MIDYRLIEAVKKKDYLESKKLINACVAVNRTDKNERTALMHAVKNNDKKLVALLLKNNADIHCTDKHGHTALSLAADIGSTEIVAILLQAGANIHHLNKAQKTPLTLAAESGHELVVRQLLLANADINHVNECGETALLSLTKACKTSMVNFLLENGADINHADQSGKTALFWAVETGDVSLVETLLEHRANINASDEMGKTPLVYAIEKGDVGMIAYLIKANAGVTETLLKEKQILRWAHEHQHTVIIESILGSDLISLKSTQDALAAALQRINTITENIQGKEYKKDRLICRRYFSSFIKHHYDAVTKEADLLKLEMTLARLTQIKDGLNIIQANDVERRSGKEKSAMRKIKSLISSLQSEIDLLRPPAENTISYKILELFKNTEDGSNAQLAKPVFQRNLARLMPALVNLNEVEINQVRKTVVRLTVDQRKLLRDSLKSILDNTAIKNNDDLTEEDRWIEHLHTHYKVNETHIPFVAILRVSGSGEKENYDTNTYDHFVRVMQNGQFQYNAGNSVVKSSHGFFSNGKKKVDVTGQQPKPNRTKFGYAHDGL